MTTGPIALTGATGAVGGMVASRLSERGLALRLLVRDPSRAPRLPGAEVVGFGGYHDREAVTRALEGIESLLFVSGEEAADRVEQHRSVVAAAADAGVRRIVYTSFLGASADATFRLARDHAHTEQAIRDAGMALVALRNSLYQDVLPFFVDEEGFVRGPAGDGRFAPVARTDVADVAVAMLLDPDAGGQMDVTGPRTLSMQEVAEVLTAVTGRQIQFVDETIEEAHASRAHLGAPRWLLDAWISTYLAIAAGELDRVSDTVQRCTGRPATDLEQLLKG